MDAQAPDGTAEGDLRRAGKRITLAGLALSAAANDLRVAHIRTGADAVGEAVELARRETERVGELAEGVTKLGKRVAERPLAASRGA